VQKRRPAWPSASESAGPEGAAGPAGAAGPEGAAGPAGAAGSAGPEGPDAAGEGRRTAGV